MSLHPSKDKLCMYILVNVLMFAAALMYMFMKKYVENEDMEKKSQ